jgi:hypothetical protein
MYDNATHEDKEKQAGKQKVRGTKGPYKKEKQAECPTK